MVICFFVVVVVCLLACLYFAVVVVIFVCLFVCFSGCMPIPNLQGVPYKIPRMFGVMLHKVYFLSYLKKN